MPARNIPCLPRDPCAQPNRESFPLVQPGGLAIYRRHVVYVPQSQITPLELSLGEVGEIALWSDRVVNIAVESPHTFTPLTQLHLKGRLTKLFFTTGTPNRHAIVQIDTAQPEFATGFERQNPRTLITEQILNTTETWLAGTTNHSTITVAETRNYWITQIVAERTGGTINRLALGDFDGITLTVARLSPHAHERMSEPFNYLLSATAWNVQLAGSNEVADTNLNVWVYGTPVR